MNLWGRQELTIIIYGGFLITVPRLNSTVNAVLGSATVSFNEIVYIWMSLIERGSTV